MSFLKYLKKGTYSIRRKVQFISGDDGTWCGAVVITDANSDTYVEYLTLHKNIESASFTIYKDTTIKIGLYLSTSTALTAQTQVKFYDMQLEQNSNATDYEKYIENKTFIKNSNNIYEEFMK